MNDYGVAMTMVHVVVRPVPEVIVIVVRAAVPMMMVAAMVPATMVPSAMVPSATMMPSATMVPSATVPSTTMMPSAAVRASTMVMPTVAMVPAAEAATTTVMPTAKATTSVVPTSKAAAVMPTAEAAAVMPYHAVSNQQQERAPRRRGGRPLGDLGELAGLNYASAGDNRGTCDIRSPRRVPLIYFTRIQSKATMRWRRATADPEQHRGVHPNAMQATETVPRPGRLLCPNVASRERPTICQQLADA